jgi:hypothetical protein
VLVGDPQDGLDLLGGAREDDERNALGRGEGGALVSRYHRWLSEDVFLAEDISKGGFDTSE